MALLVLLSLVVVTIIGAILIKYFLCHDLKKSVHDVLDFVKKMLKEIIDEIFGNSNDTQYYPVRFGANAEGLIFLKLIDICFEPIYDLFDKSGTYCVTLNEVNDVIQYNFAIAMSEENDIENLKESIQKRLEKMVNQSFKEHGIFVSPIPYLDFSFDQERKPQYLYVYFAKTANGVSVLQKQKELRYLAQRSGKNAFPDDFAEGWDEATKK